MLTDKVKSLTAKDKSLQIMLHVKSVKLESAVLSVIAGSQIKINVNDEAVRF